MGGMERASVNLTNGISHLGYACTYISLFNQEKFFKLENQVRFIEPHGFNSNNLNFFKTFFWIRRLIKKNNYPFVIVFNKLYGAMVTAALIGLPTKVIVSERSSPLYYWGRKIELISKILYKIRKPHGLIAQTSIAAEYQRKYYGKGVPIKIIPNALRSINVPNDLKQSKIILAVGRLADPLKGFDRLIPAFAKLNAPNWQLVFAGGDENGQYLKNQAKELGVSNRVTFLGQIKDIDSCYAKAPIFVIPSRSEGFPNALCEAMASGCACVAFDFIAGPKDLIEHGVNGLIVEDGNIIELAKVMQILIDSPEKRTTLGLNAQKIKTLLNPEKISEDTIEFAFKVMNIDS